MTIVCTIAAAAAFGHGGFLHGKKKEQGATASILTPDS